MRHVGYSVDVESKVEERDEWTASDVVGSIKEASCEFARAMDWQQSRHVVTCCGDRGVEVRGANYVLTENHEGLHSGNYIELSILASTDVLDIKGGYYDSYRQPKTVYSGSLALAGVTAEKLGRMLVEVHDKLSRRAREGRLERSTVGVASGHPLMKRS